MGPGRIARQFVADLQHADGATVQAVGSRSGERAEAFAKEHGIPNVHADYGSLAADPEVDIVYVATPHPQHRENVLACLGEGKAVLCEKPFTMNAAEAREIIAAARERKLFLMEAMWTRYLPAARKVKAWIDEGAIGKVQMLKADFGFRLPWNPKDRLLDKKLGGGALLDTGVYPVSFASWVFGRQPERIQSAARLGETGVDEWYTAIFDYGDDRMASITNAVRLPLNSEALIIGEAGKIHVPSFFSARDAKLTRLDGTEETFSDKSSGRGMQHEAEEAMRCVREGILESPVMPLDETLAIMETLDAVRKPWGLRYEADGVREK